MARNGNRDVAGDVVTDAAHELRQLRDRAEDLDALFVEQLSTSVSSKRVASRSTRRRPTRSSSRRSALLTLGCLRFSRSAARVMLLTSAITTKVRKRFQSSSQTSRSNRDEVIPEIYALYFHYLFAQC